MEVVEVETGGRSKKRKVSSFDLTTKKPVYVKDFTVEEETSFAISTLDLSEEVNFKYAPVDTTKETFNNTEPMVKSVRDMHKASAELSRLTTVTGMLKQLDFLALQTSFRSAIHEDKKYTLPLLQSIDILKNNLQKCKEEIANAAEESRQTAQNRKTFAKGLFLLKQRWAVVHCNTKTLKVLQTKKRFDPLTDSVAVDCSFLSSGKNRIELGSSKAPPEKNFMIPLCVKNEGIAVQSTALDSYKPKSLKLSLVDTASREMFASKSAWERDNYQHNLQPRAGVSREDELSLQRSVDEVDYQCRLLQHEAKCSAMFSKLKEECANVSMWVQNCKRLDVNQNSEPSRDTKWGCFLSENLRRTLTVSSITHDTIYLTISESISLEISFTSIAVHEAGYNTDKTSAAQPSRLERLLTHTLSVCIVHAESLLLDHLNQSQSVDPHAEAKLSKNETPLSDGYSNRERQRQALFELEDYLRVRASDAETSSAKRTTGMALPGMAPMNMKTKLQQVDTEPAIAILDGIMNVLRYMVNKFRICKLLHELVPKFEGWGSGRLLQSKEDHYSFVDRLEDDSSHPSLWSQYHYTVHMMGMTRIEIASGGAAAACCFAQVSSSCAPPSGLNRDTFQVETPSVSGFLPMPKVTFNSYASLKLFLTSTMMLSWSR